VARLVLEEEERCSVEELGGTGKALDVDQLIL